MNRIFVYGTLKSEKVQRELFGKVLKKAPARLENYALFEAEDGWYFVREEKGKSVEGFIIEMDDDDLKICDAFEYYPEMYQKRPVEVVTGEKKVEAYIYVRVDDVGRYKEIKNFNAYSRLNEDEFINTEVKKFKEVEHPEFYR